MNDFKDKVAPWIGVLAILGFGVFIIFLLKHLGDSEPQWSRMVFIFGAVEAAGLAALGFFFGKEVNRARAEKAEDRANTNAQTAQTATGQRAVAQQKLSDLNAFIEEKLARRKVAPSPRAAKTRPPSDDEWEELASFARRLAQPDRN